MTGPVKPDGKNDLKLLLAEVIQYIDRVRTYLTEPSFTVREELRHKAAYIARLAVMVRNQTFDSEREAALDEAGRRYYHGLAAITSRLSRIAELALNVVRQLGHLSRSDFLIDYDLDDFFEEIDLGLNLIGPALAQGKLKMVVRLCRLEEKLDAHYADRFARLIRELDEGCGQPGDRVTTLMIVHYLERIGDFLLEIGEEMIYIIIGQNIKYSQFQALGQGLKASGSRKWLNEAEKFQAIAGGRSGCSIGVVAGTGGEVGEMGGEAVIFKHGPVEKMEKERMNLTAWNELWPGLPPAVKAFVPGKVEGEAGLVLEYIPGPTLKDMFMDNGQGRVALKELARAMHIITGLWRETRLETEAKAGFVHQAEKRLGPVQALYPELAGFSGRVGSLEVKPLTSLLEEARNFERGLSAPFTVRIHGDFNLSNIMLNECDGGHRFIDLYRSRLSDYVQDVSVMILSVLRLPLTGTVARNRLSTAARLVYTFAQDFASSAADHTFTARLAFGLARSYLTSARFEIRRPAAARFIGYSRYLWENLVKYGRSGQPWEDFKLDKRVLHI